MRRLILTTILIAMFGSAVFGAPATNTTKLEQLSFDFTSKLQLHRTQLYYDLLSSTSYAQARLNANRDIKLMFIDDRGQPRYYMTTNLNAARTVSTDKVWPGGMGGYTLTGSETTLGLLGVWDGGGVRTSHVEFGGRVTQVDSPGATHYHSTHVAGTMVAEGDDPAAKGMSYEAELAAYDWDNDNSEMATAAANGMTVSNHSYGFIAGWYYDSPDWYWYGDVDISPVEDYQFGLYTTYAQDWDQIAYNAPYYTIVKSAGNDRNDFGPTAGTEHYVWGNSGWELSTDVRDPDGGADGYDCVMTTATAKNIITVGAIYDITSGYSAPGDVSMSSFSGWGPTDDGRIKPDLVANGIGLYSTDDANNTSYVSLSGTSMAAPNLSGSLNLLVRHYEATHSNNTPLSATMKATLIQSADESGPNPGPDYMFGWGLMNTLKAADLIDADVTDPNRIREESLANGEIDQYYIGSDGVTPIRVTVAWTDIPGTPPVASLNPTTPMLVSDLDLRIEYVATSTVYQPYLLNPSSPASAATTGDNTVDNVEQVYIAAPAAGTYLVTVSHKGSLTLQNYSIVSTHSLLSQTTRTWYVTTSGSDATGDGTSGNPFASIQHAVDQSGPDDTVAVAAGTYDENVECSHSLYFHGEDAATTIIDAGGLKKALWIRNAPNTHGEISGFTLTNSGAGSTDGWLNAGLVVESDGTGNWLVFNNISTGNAESGIITTDAGRIERNVVSQCGSGGILVTTNAAITINQNVIHSCGSGLVADAATTSVSAMNNIISENTLAGIDIAGGVTYSANYNDVWNNSPNYTITPGANDISLDPMFIGGLPFDYGINCESPCIDAGDPGFPLDPDGTTADMGVYPYDQTSCADTDGDCFGDPGNPGNVCPDDNCPSVYNPDQVDSDDDGVGDACDICAGFDDTIDGDADGVPDGCDVCAGFDDTVDADDDSVPDGCDVCAGFDDTQDADFDGVPDGCDICAGYDDTVDADDDGVPDGCDVCAGFDDTVDADFDGVPDGCDVCAGFDDTVDADDDGVPDGCDVCSGFDDTLDADFDGVPDGCDICAGFDDALDADADTVPDGCDNCIDVFNPDQTDTNGDNVGDACTTCCENMGDFDHSGQVDVSDIVVWVGWAFNSKPTAPGCEYPDGFYPECDMDGSAQVDVADVVFWVAWSFDGGPDPTDCQ